MVKKYLLDRTKLERGEAQYVLLTSSTGKLD